MKLPQTFVSNTDRINAVIETPKGCAAKYNFDEETGLFKLKKILPEGLVFPFHFGFIPQTIAEDGDPIDVLVLMDEPSWPGCYIECRVIGNIKAQQHRSNNPVVRNDRIVAAAVESCRFKMIKELSSLDAAFINEIINFFISYTRPEDKNFRVMGKQGSQAAIESIKRQMIK